MQLTFKPQTDGTFVIMSQTDYLYDHETCKLMALFAIVKQCELHQLSLSYNY